MIKAPKILELILRRFLRYDDQEAYLGDFEERYIDIVTERGRFTGFVWYFFQIILSIPKLIKNNTIRGTAMLKNYLKITFRNLLKHKSYSFLNITGLALGIACCLLILIYVLDELSFDRYHENANEIYRIVTDGVISGRQIELATTPAPMGPTMVDEFPEVLNSVRILQTSAQLVKFNDRIFNESSVLFADNSIFDIFSFELLKGDPQNALVAPYSMVITEEIAEKYFGQEDPIGKVIEVNSTFNYTVTGVIKKPKRNSHFTFDLLPSLSTLSRASNMEFWGGMNYYTYLQLRKNVDLIELDRKLIEFSRDKFAGLLAMVPGAELSHYLQPMTSIHLYSNLESELSVNSSIRYVYAFSTVALFILIIACINFMNLTTARSSNRAKEIGMRKVMGAYRKQLTKQFLGESVLFSLISLPAALILVKLSEPLFINITGKDIRFDFQAMPELMLALILIVVFVGIAAGSYPAIFLSGFKPVKTIKGELKQGAKHSKFRNILVVSQFTISVFLIIGSFIILDQLNYMKNKDLGFDKEQLFVLNFRPNSNRSTVESLKSEIKSMNGVINASISSSVPGSGPVQMDGFFPEGLSDNQSVIMERIYVDEDYLDTFGLDLIQGRNFAKEMSSDFNNTLLVNEYSVNDFNWREPVGKKIEEFTGDDLARRPREVIGVLNNFHLKSLYNSIQPLSIAFDWNSMRYLTAKIYPENISDKVKQIESKWNTMFPGQPYTYFFLDESFDSMYNNEERLGVIFRSFTGLAIIIGCLGLFGLASFTAEQRTKEIGIRKSLGSSIRSIVALLIKNYMLLIIMANLIAWPASFFLMKIWLKSFPYQASIETNNFFFAMIITAMTAVLSVIYQTLKAALSNPVDALRYE
ncbi:MAG: FtsX-like permease family protein [bacterium]|nr:FtsX-like permease family protein [bacterium]